MVAKATVRQYRHLNIGWQDLPQSKRSATIIISQLPTEQWYEVIGDNTLADTILDRLMHNAHRMNLQEESMRKKMNSLTQVEHLE